jgi:tetratricopeptide (TPR) repeat protein
MKSDVAAETKEDMKAMKQSTLYETILLKAQILSSSGDHRGAIAIYDEMNAGEFKGPGTFYAASMEHQLAGDTIDIQIALMDSCMAMFPDSLPQDAATFVMRRAKLYTTAGQYRKAVADYNTFYEINKGQVSHTFYYDRSQLELQGRMYQQALDDINKAVEMMPESPLYLVEKSAMHLRVNQLDECVAAAEKCIAISQQYPDAYRILGYAQIQKGDKVSARRNLEKAKELGDESAQEIMDKFLK